MVTCDIDDCDRQIKYAVELESLLFIFILVNRVKKMLMLSDLFQV